MIRRERFQIDIGATRAEVWDRLTTGEGIASWFGTRGEIDLRIGGERIVGWGDGMEIHGTVADIEAGTRLRVVYTAGGAETGAEEWLISTTEGTTRLTLIYSLPDDGIDDWDGFFGDIQRGWKLFLESMRHALEDAAVPNREAECVFVPAVGPPEGTWDRVGAALGDSPVVEGLRLAMEMPPHSRLYLGMDRTLLLDVEGSGSERVLYAQAATHGVNAGHWRSTALELAWLALSD